MIERKIYMDNASTTALSHEALEAMLPYMTEEYGNPSSIHSFGRAAKKAVEQAREKIALALGAETDEIYFTSGGTEADNWAIMSAVQKQPSKGRHIITSAIEHHAVLENCAYLEKCGYDITYIKPDKNGVINPIDIKNALRDDTILITIMMANNETGVIQPIEQIGKFVPEGVLFHTDAVQAVGNIPIDVKKLNIDYLSLSAHKFYGPKGVGVLYCRKNTYLQSLLRGGYQESKKRAGTENVTGIIGLGEALHLAVLNIDANIKKVSMLRDKLQNDIVKVIPDVKVNGDTLNRLPGILNLCVNDADSESMISNLDMKGIAVSGGAACSAGSLEASHVLLTMGLSEKEARSSVRFSLGKNNTMEDVDYCVNNFAQIIDRLRKITTLYADKSKSKQI